MVVGRNPRPETPNDDPSLHDLTMPSRSLVEQLGDVVDDLRQLNTDFGLRPYKMLSICVKWSGGRRGLGDPTVVHTMEFLPTPYIKWSQGEYKGQAYSAGVNDKGNISVTELSPRYTEDEIRTLFHVKPLPEDIEGFIEVVMDDRDGCEPKRRRFVVQSVPYRDAENFQWVVQLKNQQDSRNRDGTVPNVSTTHFSRD